MANREEQSNGHAQINTNTNSQQLEKQVEELRKANEELVRLKNVEKFAATGRMARAIAHEIRNPLTNISLALEQLTSEIPANEDATLLVDMISRNTMRINQLITDLLSSTKFGQLTYSSVSINTILDEIVEQNRHVAQHKNVQIEENFTESLPEITADKEKIKTAFENLVIGAIELVESNDGKILIKTSNENHKCLVTIHTSGVSLNEEKMESLFEPRFTGKSGSGLALILSQNIILNHGGNIYVESEQGKGTTFTVVLDFA